MGFEFGLGVESTEEVRRGGGERLAAEECCRVEGLGLQVCLGFAQKKKKEDGGGDDEDET
jgi:hypothetical protein